MPRKRTRWQLPAIHLAAEDQMGFIRFHTGSSSITSTLQTLIKAEFERCLLAHYSGRTPEQEQIPLLRRLQEDREVLINAIIRGRDKKL